jgi:hypothetical protein
VTIIVVTYRGKGDTLACLKSLSELTYNNFRVIVVDQNSGDGTPEAVRAQYPVVEVIENPVNDGFTGGNNLGMRAALKHSTKYLFLLNNDTVVEPGLLEKLVAPLEADRKVGIIGPTILYFGEPEIICWAGSGIDWRGRSSSSKCGQSIKTLEMRMRETGTVSGCAMLIRRAVLEQVGLLDNRFFIYYEENDLCERARRVGWKLVYLPTAMLWHKESQVTKTVGNDFGYYHMTRNRLLYLWKNASPRLLACLYCIGSTLKQVLVLVLRGQAHEAIVMLRALRDSLTGQWGDKFFSYKK